MYIVTGIAVPLFRSIDQRHHRNWRQEFVGGMMAAELIGVVTTTILHFLCRTGQASAAKIAISTKLPDLVVRQQLKMLETARVVVAAEKQNGGREFIYLPDRQAIRRLTECKKKYILGQEISPEAKQLYGDLWQGGRLGHLS